MSVKNWVNGEHTSIIPPHGVFASYEASITNATTNLYTVPANQVYYFTGFSLGVYSASGGACEARVHKSGGAKLTSLLYISLTTGHTFKTVHSFTEPIICPAGTYFQGQSWSAALTLVMVIRGYVYNIQ